MTRLEKLLLASASTALLLLGIVLVVTIKDRSVWVDRLSVAHRETMAAVEAGNSQLLKALTTSNQRNVEALTQYIDQLENLRISAGARSSAEIAASRTVTPCPAAGARTLIQLAAGQSNADNYVGALTRSKHGAHIVEFYQGKCYVAEDPMIGGSAFGGTTWIPLANSLVESGLYENVVIALVAKGGSSISQWRNGGDLNTQLSDITYGLHNAGLPPSIVTWVQGEAERYPDSKYQQTDLYLAALRKVVSTVKKVTPSAAFYVTLASYCPLDRGSPKPIASVRSAQSAAADPSQGIFVGPDLDAIHDWEDRYDLCHLTARGNEKFVESWLRVIARK